MSLAKTRTVLASLATLFCLASTGIVRPTVAADTPTSPSHKDAPATAAKAREVDKLTSLPGEVTKLTFASDGKHLFAQTYFEPAKQPGFGIGGGGPGYPVTTYHLWTFAPRKVSRLNPIVFGAGGCLPSPNLHTMATWNPIGPDTMTQDFHDVDADVKGAKPKTDRALAALNKGGQPPPIAKADRPKAWKWWEETMEPLAFSPDGKVAAAKIGKNHTVALFDMSQDKRIAKIELAGDKLLKVPGVVFSADGKFVAVPCMDGSPVLVCEVAGGKVRGRVGKYHAGSVLSLSGDGKSLALANAKSGDVQLWDVAGGKLRDTWRTGGRGINDVAYSNDGNVVFAAMDRLLLVWDAVGRREIARLRGHTGAIGVLAVSADGKRLASGGKDKTVRLWDISADASESKSRSQPSPVQKP